MPGWTALRYDRAAIAGGQLWRLVTGHFAHLGPAHLTLNLAGLLLVWWLIGRAYSALGWLFVVSFSIAGIDLGFWFLDRQLAWYVGLSGLLHGLLVAGILRHIRALPAEYVVLGVLIVAKIGYEQFAGPLPGTRTSIEGAVVVNAHLYGAIAGALAGLLLLVGGGIPAAKA